MRTAPLVSVAGLAVGVVLDSAVARPGDEFGGVVGCPAEEVGEDGWME